MLPYIPLTEDDKAKMCKDIGINSIDDLFKDIPEDLRLNRDLNINNPMSELEVSNHMRKTLSENSNNEELVCFLGAGAYDHYIPSLIKHITSRSEFYTAYTPYQPEISQGTLQSIFEYQSMIAEITGMEVSNASMYDGGTALTEAAVMAVDSTRRNKIVISKTVNPETRQILKTYCHFKNIDVIEIGYVDGETNIDELKNTVDKTVGAVIVQNPNFFGIVEKFEEVEKISHESKSLLIMSVDPISLALLKSPGEIGADIAVGEGQSLGNPLNFGGPYLGFMATSTKLMRKMPGRFVGETVDADGKRAYVLTLQAREQHIRREKASSNICSNQGLNALTAAIYMATMGKEGLKEVAEQSMKKAHYAFSELTKSGNYKPLFNKPFFMEFALTCDTNVNKLNENLMNNGIIGGYEIEKSYPELKNSVLLCVTEKRTKNEIDNLVKGMEG